MAKENVVDLLHEISALKKTKVSLDDALKIFGNRAYAPMYFLLGLILLSPLGALPGATAVIGSTIALLALESLFTPTPWIPNQLRKRSVPRNKFKSWVKRSEPYIKRAERYTRARLTLLSNPPFSHALSLFVLILGISTYGLGLIPGGLILPGLALACIGIAQFHHDGIWIAAALILGFIGISIGIMAL